MAYGVTSIGFIRKTLTNVVSDVSARLRRTIDDRLIIDGTTALGNIVYAVADETSQAWEALEEAWNAFDPDNATDSRLVALAEVTGTVRRAMSKGSVLASVNLDGGRTFAAGALVAHIDGARDNRWYNRDEIVTPAGAAAAYTSVFVSEIAGSTAHVDAGDLTEIAGAVTGWNSVTNAGASDDGEDEETIEALRERRTRELQQAGSCTAGAIAAEVSAVADVVDAVVFENTTNVTVGGIPPHGIRVVVYGPAASDDVIAQGIFNARAAGIPSSGGDSGTALALDGTAVTEAFDRATEFELEIDCVLSDAADETDTKALILRAFGGLTEVQALEAITSDDPVPLRIGADVIHLRLKAAPLPIVGDVTTFEIGELGGALAEANITIAADVIATLKASNIAVSP